MAFRVKSLEKFWEQLLTIQNYQKMTDNTLWNIRRASRRGFPLGVEKVSV